MENPEIPGRIQMERFIPVEIFRKKKYLFGLLVPGFMSEKKNYRYSVNGTTQSSSCFWCQKTYQYDLTEIFHRNSRPNGKRSFFCWENNMKIL